MGYAAVFNSRSEDLGGMVEIIEPGAFTKALRASDVRALLNHDPSLILGRTKSGTLRLSQDDVGLRAEIDLPPSPTGDSVLESVRRGDISHMSFAFRVVAGVGDKYSIGNDGVTVRRILEVEQLVDVSPVAFPAYVDTVVSVRALELAKGSAGRAPGTAADTERQRCRQELASNATLLERVTREERGEEDRRLREKVREEGLRALVRVAHDEAEMRWLERVAVHEAGHALLYWSDGAGVESVGLVFRDGRLSGGYARCADTEVRSVHAVLAGHAAERIAGFPHEPSHAAGDLRRAREMLGGRRCTDEALQAELRAVEGYLRKSWPAVRAVADAIKRRVDLAGEEAERTIYDALRHRHAAA